MLRTLLLSSVKILTKIDRRSGKELKKISSFLKNVDAGLLVPAEGVKYLRDLQWRISTRKRRWITLSSLLSFQQHTPNNHQTRMVTMTDQTPQQEMKSCDYEKCREERIKENLERMQKLGIHDLSLKLKSIKPNNNNRKRRNYNHDKTPKCASPLISSSVPTRRSSRLQSTPAVCYAEVPVPKTGKDGRDISMAENSRPEVYTEEHEKMLGEAKTEWTLFVDGCGKDGKRIYDQVRGKTCHQCRQKTLGHRTHCIQCNMVQGQFCGDCLYMRYGENVLEAKQNPDWICPVCRGICNCSLCRQAKGWAATGVMYRKITSLGYKSVAHYLIQTRRADPNSEKNEKTETQTKRSLTFSSDEVEPEDGAAKSDNMKSEDGIATNKVNKDEKPTELQISDEPLCNNEKLESDQEKKNKKPEAHADGCEGEDEDVNENKNLEPKEIDSKGLVDEGEVKNKNEVKKSEVHLEFTNSENKEKNPNDEVKSSVVTPLVTKAGSRKKRCAVPLENSIAGRLRSRRKCT